MRLKIKDRALLGKLTYLCAICLVVSCAAIGGAKACLLPSSQSGIIFNQLPAGVDAPIIAEITILSREPNVTVQEHFQLAVMNARVDRVIKGSLDSSELKVVTYLNSCSRIGIGHGYVAGTLRYDAQRGVELLAVQLPYIQSQPAASKRKPSDLDIIGRSVK